MDDSSDRKSAAGVTDDMGATSSQPWTVYRRLLARVLEHRQRVIIAMISLCVASLATLAIPWLATNVFKEAVLSQDTTGVVQSLTFVLVAAGTMVLARFLAEDQIGYVSLHTVEKLRVQMVSRLIRLPLSYHARSKTGESVSRTSNDAVLLQTFTYDSMFSLGSDLLQVGGCVCFLFYLNWQLTLVLVATVPVAALAIGISSKWVRRRMMHVQVRQAEMTGLLTEQLVAMPAIQAFDAADHEIGRFSQSAKSYTVEGRHAVRLGAGARGFVNMLGVVGIVIVLVCGLQSLDLQDEDQLTALLKFAMYSALIAEPLTRMTKTMFEIQRALAAGARVFEIIDADVQLQEGTGVLPSPLQGNINFVDVSFAYRRDETILRDVTLSIAAKETVAIVGSSGSGKSTLANLLLRFHEPTAGRVELDGTDLRDVRLSNLREHIGWMGQDPHLISGTVADNIRYGKRDASLAEIEEAARMVAADEFIHDLPGGYEAKIGERGVDLSGGQKARIAMARIVVRSPEIVIFDESTAALDTDTEMLLWRRLGPWLEQRTAIIIAHRLLTIVDLPRIVVVEDGKIVGSGSAADLDKSCPAFDRLFAEQMNLTPAAA